jgi:hypothetical protein
MRLKDRGVARFEQQPLLLQHLGSPPESGQTNALAIVTELANLQILFHLLFQILTLKGQYQMLFQILVSNPDTEKGSFRYLFFQILTLKRAVSDALNTMMAS